MLHEKRNLALVALMVVLVMNIPLIITATVALLVLQHMRAIVHLTVVLFVKFRIVILIIILISITIVRIVATVHLRVIIGLNFKLVIFSAELLVFSIRCRILLHGVQQIGIPFPRLAADAFVDLDAKDKLKNLSIKRQNDPNALDLCMLLYIKILRLYTFL